MTIISGIKIYKQDLPGPEVIKQINYSFYQNARKAQKRGYDEPVYLTHGLTHNQMRKKILTMASEETASLTKFIVCFPSNSNLYSQCAYWYRAFSRSQLFLDANHRTGFFSLQNVLRKKELIIDASNEEITALTYYIKNSGWIKQGEMVVNLKEKDDEYYKLKTWFSDRLKFR